MQIILSRHGNTFNTEDRVVWVGANQDLPLVDRGIEQAANFARALGANAVVPAAIYSGPLVRTSKYAQVIIDELRLPLQPIVDERLNELDYGLWSGLTNDEVVGLYGKQLYAWTQQSIWPPDAAWGSSEQEVRQQIRSFVLDLLGKHGQEDTVIAVSSNGRLRYFLDLVPGEFQSRIQERSLTVKTGHICKLSYRDNRFQVDFWNMTPDALCPSPAS